MKSLRWVTLLVAAALLSPGIALAEGRTVVLDIEGGARVVRNGQEMSLAADTPLQDGDVIRTGEGQTADFSMNGLAGGRVLPGSECEIESSGESDMSVRLKSGKVMMNLKKLKGGSKFRVVTPTAIAAVRGTQFMGEVILGAQTRSTFSVRDDAVEVQRLEGGNPVGEPVRIEAGFSCDVFQQGLQELSVRPATGAEVAAMEQASVIRCC